MQCDDGIVSVVFAVQQCCNTQLFEFRQECVIHFFYFFVYAFILFFDPHFDQCQDVFVCGHKIFEFANLVFQTFQLLQCFLAFFQIIPEIGVSRKFF